MRKYVSSKRFHRPVRYRLQLEAYICRGIILSLILKRKRSSCLFVFALRFTFCETIPLLSTQQENKTTWKRQSLFCAMFARKFTFCKSPRRLAPRVNVTFDLNLRKYLTYLYLENFQRPAASPNIRCKMVYLSCLCSFKIQRAYFTCALVSNKLHTADVNGVRMFRRRAYFSNTLKVYSNNMYCNLALAMRVF